VAPPEPTTPAVTTPETGTAEEGTGVCTAAGRVAVGFFSFTEVTDVAQHRAYNEWHQLDHLPEQLPLEGVVWGQRWVRTPACRAVGAAARSGFDAVHYVTCYLMTPPVVPTLRGFQELGADLRRRGRFFDARRALLSGPFTVIGARAAPRVQVSAAAVPFRPNLGAYVALWGPSPPTDPPRSSTARWEELLELPGVAGLWQFEAHPAGTDFGWRSDGHSALVCYLDAPPLDVAPAIEHALAGPHARGAAPLLAGPLETITPWQWDWFDAR
jgi:hypothetical protein